MILLLRISVISEVVGVNECHRISVLQENLVSICLKLKYKSHHSTQVQCCLCFEVHNMKHDTLLQRDRYLPTFLLLFSHVYSQVIAHSRTYIPEQRVHEIHFSKRSRVEQSIVIQNLIDVNYNL